MMNLRELAKVPALNGLPVKRWVKKFNALPQRDRMAILAGGLALIVGLEFQVVMGLHDRRVALLGSQPEADPVLAQQEALTLAKQQEELARLQAELARRAPVQTISAEGAAPREVFASLKRAMALQQVDIVGLKAIPADEPVNAKPHETEAEAGSEEVPSAESEHAASAPDGDGVQPLAQPKQDIFRHQIELRVAGSLTQVLAVLKGFDGASQPLRLERVKVMPSKLGQGHVEAALDLVFISRERTWLAM